MGNLFSEVFERDNHRCVYCGRNLLVDFETFMITEEDHLVPKSSGGEHELYNVVTSCAVCNRLKGTYVPKKIKLNKNNRDKYIADIRKYIMIKRSEHMADFTTWTHPEIDS